MWVFEKLQEESVWIIHSSVETWKKVTLDELASCALLALLWAFVSWFVIRSLHNDFPTDGGFPSPFLSLPRFFGKTIQFDLCDSKTTSFFGVFEIIILPSQKMLCSCWLHCLCPGTCPASWGLRGKDLVFLQHGHMGITATRQQKLLVFCVDQTWANDHAMFGHLRQPWRWLCATTRTHIFRHLIWIHSGTGSIKLNCKHWWHTVTLSEWVPKI